MDEPAERTRSAWQPLTWRGVAAFADAPAGRLFWVQLLVALLAAAAAVWFVQSTCFPTVSRAILRLPPQGELRSGVLDWQGESPTLLADGHFLALVVDLRHDGAARSPAQLEVEFGRTDLKIISLLGYLAVPYRADWAMPFNRPELEPRWGAWQPMLLAILAGGVTASLMLAWAALATIYCLPVWLAARLAGRLLSLTGAWRLAGAALMPAALLMISALLVYGLGALDLIHVAVAVAAHLALGWAYLFAGVRRRPRKPAPAPPNANPFAISPSPNPGDHPGPAPRSANAKSGAGPASSGMERGQ